MEQAHEHNEEHSHQHHIHHKEGEHVHHIHHAEGAHQDHYVPLAGLIGGHLHTHIADGKAHEQ